MKQENKELAQMPTVDVVTEDEMEDSRMKLLHPKQQRFVHMYMSGQYSVPQIAKLLNMSYNGVRKWLKNPEIKGIIDEYQSEEDDIIRQCLKATRIKALEKLNELLDSNIDGIKYQAVRDILDRTGHKAVQKNETKVEIYTFEQQLKEAMDFVDVDFKEIDE